MVDRDSVAESWSAARRHGPLRRPYWLPNALTTLALLCGFSAIVQGLDGNPGGALVLLLVAGFFDAMDGRVARMTNAQSAFGVEYDSLSDMTCFGVAPALVCYEWLLHETGLAGLLAMFFYCACAAWRLARFNLRTGSSDPRWFQGLPSPAAGILLMGYVWLVARLPADSVSQWAEWGALAVAIVGGLLMISSIPFPSGKKASRRHLKLLSAPALAFAVVGVQLRAPLGAIYLLVVAYCLAGPFLLLWAKLTMPWKKLGNF